MWRRVLAFGMLLLGVCLWFLPRVTANNRAVTASPSSVPTLVLMDRAPRVEEPTQLMIPSQGVAASIRGVGITSSGAMAAPESIDEVGWYDLGVKPGELGSAILVGHLNGFTSPYGVFRRLREVTPGSEIAVADAVGNNRTFLVRDSMIYKRQEVPLTEYLTQRQSTEVVLITCAGPWEWQAGTYRDRLVVRARILP